MLFRCIVCQATWGKGDPEEGYSDGLCKEHEMILLVKLYRERQAKEKNPDCCGRSSGYCDRFDCRFRAVCLNPVRPPVEVIDWALEELKARAAARMAEKKSRIAELFDGSVSDTVAVCMMH